MYVGKSQELTLVRCAMRKETVRGKLILIYVILVFSCHSLLVGHRISGT